MSRSRFGYFLLYSILFTLLLALVAWILVPHGDISFAGWVLIVLLGLAAGFAASTPHTKRLEYDPHYFQHK